MSTRHPYVKLSGTWGLRFCHEVGSAHDSAILIYSLGEHVVEVIRGRVLEEHLHAWLGYGSKGGLDPAPNGSLDTLEYKKRVYC